MNSILPLTQPPLILIKDLSDQWDWSQIDTALHNQQWTNDGNYKITADKKFINTLPGQFNLDILKEVSAFIKNISVIDFDFDVKITDSWVNDMSTGDIHPWHSHPFSVVSGVIFLDDHPENSDLTFKNNVNFAMPPYSLIETDYYISLRNLADIQETKNLKHHMVLFYSNISHSVPEIKTVNRSRRTLSFNTFWKGRIDFGSDLNSYDFL
jgi:uncharacterized protein (TIGR02466 family)